MLSVIHDSHDRQEFLMPRSLPTSSAVATGECSGVCWQAFDDMICQEMPLVRAEGEGGLPWQGAGPREALLDRSRGDKDPMG